MLDNYYAMDVHRLAGEPAARELESELEQLYPREPMTADYREALRSV